MGVFFIESDSEPGLERELPSTQVRNLSTRSLAALAWLSFFSLKHFP